MTSGSFFGGGILPPPKPNCNISDTRQQNTSSSFAHEKRKNIMGKILLSLATLTVAMSAMAQAPADSTVTTTQPSERLADKFKDFTVKVHGTVRGKFEWQPTEDDARFEVRNARFSLSGNVTPNVAYKAEIDLSDEGSIKMLDAYARFLGTCHTWNFTIGQMRVPFTIDAHRSPHQQYFANRSFLAKQVGNVRDVGASMSWRPQISLPLTIEGGIYNGSGLTNQKNYWTSRFNFSAKATLNIKALGIEASYQKTHPDIVDIRMIDGGVFIHTNGWHAEAEYLRKIYADDAFEAVNTFDIFLCRDIPVRKRTIVQKFSPLARWDYMSDHSDGKADEDGKLIINDYERHRLTWGLTISLATPFTADLRINYEKYFYNDGATIGVSDNDKLVCELMVRF